MANADPPPSYSNFGFDGEPIAGPSAPRYEDADIHLKELTTPNLEQSPGLTTLKYTSPSLVFEDIYEACILYVKKHSMYSSKFVKQMKLTEIKNGCAFHYTLESFGEKRESKESVTSYSGGSIDGPSNGPAPKLWDMTVRQPTLFKDAKDWETIPHTEYVESCYRCSGNGRDTCYNCTGSGNESCSSCSGSGQNDDEACSSCGGSGNTTCYRCGGSGEDTCSRCGGYGEVTCSRVLVVTWKNHPVEVITGIKGLPTKKFKKVTGDTIFHEEENTLLPIVHCSDIAINVASTCLLENCRNEYPGERIRKQRHNLKAVPFTTIKYKWKELEGEFYIYGNEKEVYFENYPTDCCCCTCF